MVFSIPEKILSPCQPGRNHKFVLNPEWPDAEELEIGRACPPPISAYYIWSLLNLFDFFTEFREIN